MTHPLRRSSLVLLWLLLALLPLRGWANLTMHLPTPDSAAVMPCHGAEAQAAEGAAEPGDTNRTCVLCDLCHGAVLLTADAAHGSGPHRQPLPTARAAPLAASEPDNLFRPPRR